MRDGVGGRERQRELLGRLTPTAMQEKDKACRPTRLLMVNGELLIVNEIVARS